MNLKKNIFTALLLTIGFVLHYISPGILGGMKFDFLLIFMFIAILLNPEFKNVVLAGLLAGLLSAMATTFPGGQVANIIDKALTSIILFGLIKILYKKEMTILIVSLIGGLGTILSGSIFLFSALQIVGLPAPFLFLFTTVVMPATVINALGTGFIYKLVNTSMKVTGIQLN